MKSLDIFVNLNREILDLIFAYLPTDFIEQLYYDMTTKSYWMNFPVQLTHGFWLNKAQKEFKMTKHEFNDSTVKGYFRYAEIVLI